MLGRGSFGRLQTAFSDPFPALVRAAGKAGQLSPVHPCETLAALSPEIARYDGRSPLRAKPMARACREVHHSRTGAARHYGVYPSTVSRTVQAFNAQYKTCPVS
jgi:hypothetical protein